MLDYHFIIPTIISTFAALFSYLAFRRGRRYNNENHLFEKKLDACSVIMGKMSSVILTLENHVISYQTLVDYPNKFDKKDLTDFDEDADNLQEEFFEFESLFASKSLLLPAGLIEKIDLFFYELQLIIIPFSNSLRSKTYIDTLDNGIDKLLSRANEIDKAMREDLNIDILNSTLYRRLKKPVD